MKKNTSAILILICMLALGVVCTHPVNAQYQSDITINADGSVTPSTAPVQQAGATYTLTSNVDGSISIYKNSAVIDGQGYNLMGEVSLNAVSNVTVKNFNITGNGGLQTEQVGIYLTETSNVVVANNTITGMGSILAMNAVGLYAGIYVDDGSSNVITGNTLLNNMDGVYFYNTENNLIVGNSITDMLNPWDGGYGPGIFFDHASNNTVYHNNLMINPMGQQAGGSDSINIWADGYPSGGNYWSDYQTKSPNAKQIDDSGIGNAPYLIDSQNMDQYPLLEPFNASYLLKYMQEITPPKISVLAPLNQTYNNSTVHLDFTVDETVNWAGYSLDGQQNVTLTGNGDVLGGTILNDTLLNMTSGFHSITIYANNSFGIMGSTGNIGFTVAKQESLPIAVVAAVSGTLAVVVVCAGLLVYFKKHKHKN